MDRLNMFFVYSQSICFRLVDDIQNFRDDYFSYSEGITEAVKILAKDDTEAISTINKMPKKLTDFIAGSYARFRKVVIDNGFFIIPPSDPTYECFLREVDGYMDTVEQIRIENSEHDKMLSSLYNEEAKQKMEWALNTVNKEENKMKKDVKEMSMNEMLDELRAITIPADYNDAIRNLSRNSRIETLLNRIHYEYDNKQVAPDSMFSNMSIEDLKEFIQKEVMRIVDVCPKEEEDYYEDGYAASNMGAIALIHDALSEMVTRYYNLESASKSNG